MTNETLSVRIEASTKKELRLLADRAYNGNLTCVVQAALDDFLKKDEYRHKNLPDYVRTRIKYIHLLMRTGMPTDLELIKREVGCLYEACNTQDD